MDDRRSRSRSRQNRICFRVEDRRNSIDRLKLNKKRRKKETPRWKRSWIKSKKNQISPLKPQTNSKILFSVPAHYKGSTRVCIVRMCVCVCARVIQTTYICIYMHMCACVYIYIHIHTDRYICICISRLGITCVSFVYVRIEIHVQIINVYFTCAIIVLVERDHPRHPSLCLKCLRL